MNFVDSRDLFGNGPTKEIPMLRAAGAPSTSTVGAVGCLYMDTDSGAAYKCTRVSDGAYTWAALIDKAEIQAIVDAYLEASPPSSDSDKNISGADVSSIKTVLSNLMTIIKAQVEDSDGTPQGYNMDVSGLVAQNDALIAALGGSSDTGGGGEGDDPGTGDDTTVVNLFDKNTMVQPQKYFKDGTPYQFISYSSRDTALVPITKTNCYYAVHSDIYPWQGYKAQFIYLVNDVDGVPTWTRRMNPTVNGANYSITYVENTDTNAILTDETVCRIDDTGTGYTFFVPDGTQYIAFGCKSSDIGDTAQSCMLEYGTACHDYVDYVGG